LEDRVRNRSLNANAALLPGAQAAVIPTPVNATPLPTNVASAPATCPCVVAPQPAKKKAD
ncbi:hypothetical protein, partial [Serratia marcescens]|uniref:hypothetical protein n=1 Tax=Serratia marcescens TaxID=615 RepID=UPI001953EC43